MKTIYQSEVLNRNFDSVEELEKAEKEFEERKAKQVALKEERAARAQEVNDAYKNYVDLKAKFIEDYGSWHMSLTEKDLPALNKLTTANIWDLFDNFWM